MSNLPEIPIEEEAKDCPTVDHEISCNPNCHVDIKFSHIHLYTDSLRNISDYKKLEESINYFYEVLNSDMNMIESKKHEPSVDVERGRQLWNSINGAEENYEIEYLSHRRDIVKQLIAGFGFRVTGCYPEKNIFSSSSTKSVLVTSSDPRGINILISSLNEEYGTVTSSEKYHHFESSNIRRFYKAHSNHQGIAVLAFEVGHKSLNKIYKRYLELHPELIVDFYKKGIRFYESEARIFEVFAYYLGEKGCSPADKGTILRFIEPIKCERSKLGPSKIPGVFPLPSKFHSSSHAAYFDHWVSNVISRVGFIGTLEDTLNFTPKVDFNAGVVAAGEAQIESTVTGNDSSLSTYKKENALRDQTQIYLPINNALSKIGHVHDFLTVIGQGVQHIASRVDDIISFVQNANDQRKMFGEGFKFLNIPRSYYGVLTKEMLLTGSKLKMTDDVDSNSSALSSGFVSIIFDVCISEGIMQADCSVNLDISEDVIKSILDSKVPSFYKHEYSRNRDHLVQTILRSRYANLYNLLGDHLSVQSYIAIVRNQILVDVQGEDLLFQIFTSSILQRKSGEEAPFLEFIQRVCSECMGPNGCPKKLKPGCGGFGIRNFLTLFLSIEVSKAMQEASNAKMNGDDAKYELSQKKVKVFTDQLNESNPILTKISNAMTREGRARDLSEEAHLMGNKSKAEEWKKMMENEALAKMHANKELMECNMKYQKRMQYLRESQNCRKTSN